MRVYKFNMGKGKCECIFRQWYLELAAAKVVKVATSIMDIKLNR